MPLEIDFALDFVPDFDLIYHRDVPVYHHDGLLCGLRDVLAATVFVPDSVSDFARSYHHDDLYVPSGVHLRLTLGLTLCLCLTTFTMMSMSS